jgi:hypothetical protein
MTQTPTTTRRTRRPMIELTGVVADLLPQDYVDEIGGGPYKRMLVGKLVHTLEQREHEFSEKQMDLALALGYSLRGAERVAERPAHAKITWVSGGSNHLLADVPVKFRRFAD